MSLISAQPHQQSLPSLPEGPPFSCAELKEWRGYSFWLEPTDSRLLDIHHGAPSPTPAMDNLEGMVKYWTEHPEWMDMLNPESPVFVDKQLELGLYLDFWGSFLNDGDRVLDVGGGVGRLTEWALNRECEVQVIEPSLHSIWRLVSQVAGGQGSIDVHWSTAESMPDLGVFDLAIACEVLNYVEDAQRAIDNIHRSLKKDGLLLLSVEARWGWAMANDVAAGSLDAFFLDGVIHIDHDRYIQTYTESLLRSLLKDFTILRIQPSHYSLSGPFENAAGVPTLDELLETEERLRNHPISKNLNRAWMVVAKRK